MKMEKKTDSNQRDSQAGGLKTLRPCNIPSRPFSDLNTLELAYERV